MKKCPCKDCLCVPICRYKILAHLFRDCILLQTYESSGGVFRSIRHSGKMKRIDAILKPTGWSS
jgi:hypothetical protein